MASKTRVPAASLRVNIDDLPEAALPGGCGPLSRKNGGQGSAYKYRAQVKNLATPQTAAFGTDDWEPEDSDDVMESSQQWSCQACTFVNHNVLPYCEVCGSGRHEPAARKASECFKSSAMQGDDWPSLRESATSFVDCETSSTGSAWVDVKGTDLVVAHGEPDVMIVSSGEGTAPLSWSLRAKSVANQGAIAKIPASGAMMPPLWRSLAKTEASIPEEIEDEDLDLMNLETRRLQPQCSKGSTQRHRLRHTVVRV
jgi:hypothetical protein